MEELFDSQKVYRWEQDQEVTISGAVFGVLLNVLSAEVSKPETQLALKQAEALQHMRNVVRDEVNAGRFVEQVAPPPTSNLPEDLDYE